MTRTPAETLNKRAYSYADPIGIVLDLSESEGFNISIVKRMYFDYVICGTSLIILARGGVFRVRYIHSLLTRISSVLPIDIVKVDGGGFNYLPSARYVYHLAPIVKLQLPKNKHRRQYSLNADSNWIIKPNLVIPQITTNGKQPLVLFSGIDLRSKPAEVSPIFTPERMDRWNTFPKRCSSIMRKLRPARMLSKLH